ncbi:MAG: cytochrome c oxidase accessory protein CcoG [Crocinitomicaceae bacterium]
MKEEDEAFRDRIATVNEKGRRIWIFPKKPSGKFYAKRKLLSYLLLALLFGGPHIRIGSEPLLLLDIIHRKFVLFGQVFWPQDMYLFAIFFIIGIVFIIFFTIIFGRLFCGWVCPQTIFMEMLFRRIEYLIDGDWTEQKRLEKSPWNREKIIKRTIKHVIFWWISFFISNTFLAYIIGSEALWNIQTDPLGKHLGGLIAIVIFTYVFYGVFAFLREQVCTTICPYGRLQGVLLDQNTMVVAYDNVRGEERAKIHKNEDRKALGKGDCIDCGHCIHVCPTGIDIRNGTQLECINCTACIDACDHMMDAVGQEQGLIRFVSENGIKQQVPFQWTRRVKAYSLLLIGLLITLTVLLITRKSFETNILRQKGSTFQVDEHGIVSNIFEIKMLNKTHNPYRIHFELDDKNAKIETVGKSVFLKSESKTKAIIVVKIPNALLKNGMKKFKIHIFGNGQEIEVIKTKFIGPIL